MIELSEGTLLRAEAEALVNTVNCVGFMGKGIALQFKQAYPETFTFYAKACRQGLVQPGRMLVHDMGQLVSPRYIIHFPTKNHWRGNSKVEWIESGLVALVQEVIDRQIRSVAIPPLGCGNGGLDWDIVGPMIRRAFESLPDVRVLLYAPKGSPAAKTMPVGTKEPKMTVSRALFIKLMEQYASLHYSRTLLEVQKLAYFLQEAGEGLKLRYEKGRYGPYADNLNKVMERLEGHFTRGYGDSQNKDAEIDLLPGAVEKADQFLVGHAESIDRLRRVSKLIEGFETPYGLELLATAHWSAKYYSPPAVSAEEATNVVHAWTARKKNIFKPRHVGIAWQRLAEQKWL